jgi:hypothetical protein
MEQKRHTNLRTRFIYLDLTTLCTIEKRIRYSYYYYDNPSY